MKIPVVAYLVVERKMVVPPFDRIVSLAPLEMNEESDGGCQMGDIGHFEDKDKIIGVIPAWPNTFAVYYVPDGKNMFELLGYEVPGGEDPVKHQGVRIDHYRRGLLHEEGD